jgi:hypothetical protein
MNRLRKALFLFFFVGCFLPFTSCEKLLLGPDPEADPSSVFEHLWEDLGNRYAYFELKGIDWDSVGQAFRSRVRQDMDQYELFGLLADMLYELRDGHVNLTSSFDRSRNWEWFLEYPANYNQNIVERNYLGTDYRITGPLHSRVIDSVLYVNYRSFGDDIGESHLDQLVRMARGLKGVILDVRSNGGGSLQNSYRLSGRFADQPYVYALERFKTGPGQNDFSGWRELKINPSARERFGGRLVLLTNRKTYSAANFMAQMVRTLPRGIVMGDQSGGGGGIPAFGELPNGWKYRFSASQTVTPEGAQLETGVPVDIQVDMLAADEQKGVDTIIEAALAWLKAQN